MGHSEKVLRFHKTERMLHWAIAIPFMICWLSALILFVVYNPDPHRSFRSFFSVVHRLSGISLIVLPIVVLVKGRNDLKLHLSNIKTAWLWSLNDIKWILLMGLAAISKRFVLPEQGKFNAAEKVNFMLVMVSLPILAVTGVMMILQDIPWVAWLVHGGMALLVTPTMLGHIYMATVNPDTRVGLNGMTTGYVESEWARHHYAIWYRERFGHSGTSKRDTSGRIQPPDQKIYIHCPSCAKNLSVPWSWLLQRIFALTPLLCPDCGARFAAITAVTNEEQLKRIMHELEQKRSNSQTAA
ncbi:MAG: cytochrome b/b6 domain-containing protein [Bacteroidota bacterium]